MLPFPKLTPCDASVHWRRARVFAAVWDMTASVEDNKNSLFMSEIKTNKSGPWKFFKAVINFPMATLVADYKYEISLRPSPLGFPTILGQA